VGTHVRALSPEQAGGGDRGTACDWGSENKRLALINHLHQLTVCIFFTDLSLLGYLVWWAGRPKCPYLHFPVPRAVWLRRGDYQLGGSVRWDSQAKGARGLFVIAEQNSFPPLCAP